MEETHTALSALKRKAEKDIADLKENVMAGLVHIKVKSAAIVDENQDLEDELRNIKERHEDESYSTF